MLILGLKAWVNNGAELLYDKVNEGLLVLTG